MSIELIYFAMIYIGMTLAAVTVFYLATWFFLMVYIWVHDLVVEDKRLSTLWFACMNHEPEDVEENVDIHKERSNIGL